MTMMIQQLRFYQKELSLLNELIPIKPAAISLGLIHLQSLTIHLYPESNGNPSIYDCHLSQWLSSSSSLTSLTLERVGTVNVSLLPPSLVTLTLRESSFKHDELLCKQLESSRGGRDLLGFNHLSNLTSLRYYNSWDQHESHKYWKSTAMCVTAAQTLVFAYTPLFPLGFTSTSTPECSVNNPSTRHLLTMPKLRTLILQSSQLQHMVDEWMVKHTIGVNCNDNMMIYSRQINNAFPSLHTLCISIGLQSGPPFKQLVLVVQHILSLRKLIIDLDDIGDLSANSRKAKSHDLSFLPSPYHDSLTALPSTLSRKCLVPCYYHHIIDPVGHDTHHTSNSDDDIEDEGDDNDRSIDATNNDNVGRHETYIVIIPSTATASASTLSPLIPSKSSYYNVTLHSVCLSLMMLSNINVSTMIRRISPLRDLKDPRNRPKAGISEGKFQLMTFVVYFMVIAMRPIAAPH
jgi:hypothetical protein